MTIVSVSRETEKRVILVSLSVLCVQRQSNIVHTLEMTFKAHLEVKSLHVTQIRFFMFSLWFPSYFVRGVLNRCKEVGRSSPDLSYGRITIVEGG